MSGRVGGPGREGGGGDWADTPPPVQGKAPARHHLPCVALDGMKGSDMPCSPPAHPLRPRRQLLFRVGEGERLEGLACCSLMSPDVLGRPVVVCGQRSGLVEGGVQVLQQDEVGLPACMCVSAGVVVGGGDGRGGG